MQGFNMGRYYAPDASNAPSFNTSNPLGARAKNIIRFELPFAVWCSHCTPAAIVGQGVRFNAEKKKVGNYYSTPIWSFRMKHTACGGWWEIRTDPKITDYVVVEGAKKRDYGPEDKGEEEGEMRFLAEEEREKRRADAFAQFEGTVQEKGVVRAHAERLEELYEEAEVWRDPYEVNARLRRDFRAKRKGWQREDRRKEGMQERFSFGYEIADATEADDVRAKLVEFGASGTSEDAVDETTRKPLFDRPETNARVETGSTTKNLKSEMLAEKSRHNLQQVLVGNTRASIDPFLSADATSTPKLKLGILKRKREDDTPSIKEAPSVPPAKLPAPTPSTGVAAKPSTLAALVDYDSD